MAKKVAFLVTDGFERSELEVPYNALSEAGMEVYIVAPNHDTVKSWKHTDWDAEFKADVELQNAKPEEFDALVLPGGVINPDNLRRNRQAVNFVKAFFEGPAEKPVGAICHGPWMLAEADVVRNRKMTSFSSIHTDLANAGALWEDEEVVVDGGLVTSRNPDDLPAFVAKLKEVIKAGPVAKPPRAKGYVEHYENPRL